MHVGKVARRGLGALAALAAAGLLSGGGCGSPDFFSNNVTLRNGSIEFQFVNDTDFRAAFTFGVYDGLDQTPGAALVDQARVEPRTPSPAITQACRRIAVLGTNELIGRAVDADFEDDADFDQDAFVAVVNFSDADATSPAAGQPTAGFAAGRAVLLGVDYDCGDRLIFTFVEDPDAAGGFRIDFGTIPGDNDDR